MTSSSPLNQQTFGIQSQTCASAVTDHSAMPAVGIQLEAYWRIAAVALFSCFLLAQLCHATSAEPWLGCLIGLALCGLMLTQKRLVQLQALDICLVLLSFTTMLSGHHSVYTVAGEVPVMRICILVMLYALVLFVGPSINQALFWVLSTAAAILSLSYGIITGLRYFHLTQAGLGNLVSFRDQFATLEGETPAAWITIFLALLPFPMLLLVLERTRGSKWILTTISTTVLVTIGLTFSRGLYLGTAVFLTLVALGTLRCTGAPRTMLRRILAPVCLGGLLLLPLIRPVVRTMQMAQTSSQTRSFSGRLVVWRQAEVILKSHPLIGSGLGSFAIQYARYKNPSTPIVFSAFNIGLETLVEQGLWGTLLWMAVFGCAGQRLVKSWLNPKSVTEERIVACFLLASVVSLLLRDASYASLSSGPVLTVLIMILALAANSSRTYANH